MVGVTRPGRDYTDGRASTASDGYGVGNYDCTSEK